VREKETENNKYVCSGAWFHTLSLVKLHFSRFWWMSIALKVVFKPPNLLDCLFGIILNILLNFFMNYDEIYIYIYIYIYKYIYIKY
jgi:hypothetical protein